jgi:hypothetical protein
MDRLDIKALIDAGYPFDYEMGQTIASWWTLDNPEREMSKLARGEVIDKREIEYEINEALAELDFRELSEDDFIFNMVCLVKMHYWLKREMR